MNKTNGRIAINHIMQMMVDNEHIEENFKEFIDNCFMDYMHSKKLGHSLYSLIRFNNHIVELSQIKKGLGEIGK